LGVRQQGGREKWWLGPSKDCPLLLAWQSSCAGCRSLAARQTIRIGWDADSVNAVRVAGILEECGIAALAVHGRTALKVIPAKQTGGVIAKLAQTVAIPVIGNGDLFSPQEVARPGARNENCWRHDRSRGHECAVDVRADKNIISPRANCCRPPSYLRDGM